MQVKLTKEQLKQIIAEEYFKIIIKEKIGISAKQEFLLNLIENKEMSRRDFVKQLGGALGLGAADCISVVCCGCWLLWRGICLGGNGPILREVGNNIFSSEMVSLRDNFFKSRTKIHQMLAAMTSLLFFSVLIGFRWVC